jgi:hypothetical protein
MFRTTMRAWRRYVDPKIANSDESVLARRSDACTDQGEADRHWGGISMASLG